jgi:DNA polymerase I
MGYEIVSLSLGPNLQQVPKAGAAGRKIRATFRDPEGYKLIRADFAGIELRIMAFLAKEEVMIEALRQGADLHKLTAPRLARVPLDEVTKDMRQAAKAQNFLLIYGGQADTLRKRAKIEYGVKMTELEAQEAREKFFETYPAIAKWHKEQINQGEDIYRYHHRRGLYIESLAATRTVLGRIRAWPDLVCDTTATRFMMFNSPDQGSGVDLLKACTVRAYEELPEEYRIVACIHPIFRTFDF